MGLYILTGGATGIGAAVREQLIAQGHEVRVVDIRDADLQADLSTAAGRSQAAEWMQEVAPDGIDGFVPCAGIGTHVDPPSLITRLNYFGVTATTEAAMPLLVKKGGVAVLISSNSAPMDFNNEELTKLFLEGDEEKSCQLADESQGDAVYGATKRALTRWMRRNTAAWAKQGVRVNAVAPGMTLTPLVRDNMKDERYREVMEQFRDNIPAGGAAEPSQIADVVCFLLGPDSSYCFGSMVFVDGGTDAMTRPDDF